MQYDLFGLPSALSVSALTGHIRAVLEADDVLQDIWVEGEISNWRPASSGHVYFTLKDARAALRCVVWRSTMQALPYRPGGNGEAVRVHGYVSVYEQRGDYQFYVDMLESAGQGALWAEFERLKRRLEAEGLFDDALKQALPAFPKRIGVVTSAKAAALRDILNVLARRYPLAEVVLSPALVQGEAAPPQIINAIVRLIEHQPPVEVIILARGGGSIEDLWPFNDELVVRTVAASQIPIVTGVGHETDFTLVDFAADQRAPTPSAAAEVVSPDLTVLAEDLRISRHELDDVMRRRLADAQQTLDDQRWRLQQRSPRQHIETRRREVREQQQRLQRSLTQNLRLQRERLQGFEARLQALNPRSILSRGYAIVRREDTLVSRAAQLHPADRLFLDFADGQATVQVDTVNTEENNRD